MYTFKFKNVDEAYKELLQTILDKGANVSPRGMLTLELHPAIIEIENPRERALTLKARKINYAFSLAEMLWIISGSGESWISKYNSVLTNFMDNGKLKGAYGPRLRNYNGNINSNYSVDQLKQVYYKLYNDPNSRQAQAIIFNPSIDYTPTKDFPCTTLFKFTIRNNKLDLTTYMRSNDIILGFPYDVYNFMSIQHLMALALGVELGKYYHITDSLHLYSNHFEKAKNIINDNTLDSTGLALNELHDKDYMGNIVGWNVLSDIISKTAIVEKANRLSIIHGKSNCNIEMQENLPPYWKSLTKYLANYLTKKFI